MNENLFDKPNQDIAWCPGCGNFKILEMLKLALSELNIRPENLVVVSGIGQAPKTPQYFNTHLFNGLHGRALPVASGIKGSNRSLIVFAEGGDGDMYGEGGNHFIHAVRRNPDIVHLVHNNMVYGLTKGQASPTSPVGFKTPVQIDGVSSEPINPVALAISLNASFVARAFAGDVQETKELVKKAVAHKGYALIDILQPCVTFNKVNTFKWFKDNTYYVDGSHNPADRTEAFRKATEPGKMPLGLIYCHQRPVFEDQLAAYISRSEPLYARRVDRTKLEKRINAKGTVQFRP